MIPEGLVSSSCCPGAGRHVLAAFVYRRHMALFGRGKKENVEQVVVVPAPRLLDPPAVNEAGMRSLTEHRNYVLSMIQSLPPFGMKLLDAWNLSIYEELSSDFDLPPFAVAATDGYAVSVGYKHRASATDNAESPDSAASAEEDRSLIGYTLSPDGGTPVLAGEPLPEGTDAVIPFGDVLSNSEVKAGDYVLARGAQLAKGATIANQGDLVDTKVVALLAAAGIDKVMARPRPRISVISVGDALVEPGHPKYGSQEYDVASFLLATAAKKDGATVWCTGAVTKDPDRLREVISDQLIRSDLILITGHEPADFEAIRAVTSTLGAVDFPELALNSRNHGFGLIGEEKIPFLLLPGDAADTFIAYHAIVRPVIRKLMGTEPYGHSAVACVSDSSAVSAEDVLEYGFAHAEMINDRHHVRILGNLHAPTLTDMARANALVILPAGKTLIEPGDTLMSWLLSD